MFLLRIKKTYFCFFILTFYGSPYCFFNIVVVGTWARHLSKMMAPLNAKMCVGDHESSLRLVFGLPAALE